MWKKKGGEKNEWGGERGGRMVKYEEKEKGGGRKKWIGRAQRSFRAVLS